MKFNKLEPIAVAAANVDPSQARADIQLGPLMHDVSRLRWDAFCDVMKPVHVTPTLWSVLAHLSRHEGMSQESLARALRLGSSVLSKLIDRLETAGFIQREVEGLDRRVKRVYLSAAGTQFIGAAQAWVREMSERELDGFDRQSRAELESLLRRVKSNLLGIIEQGRQQQSGA